MSIFAQVSRHKDLGPLTECPAADAKTLLNRLAQIPTMQNQLELTSALGLPHTPAQQLLSWICTTFGQELAWTNDNLRISGFPDAVHQFIVMAPSPELQNLFDGYLDYSIPRSIALFHGTSVEGIQSILRSGFNPSAHGDGVWMAEASHTSYPYAFKYGASYTKWQVTPYERWGGLLGCEVADEDKKFQGYSGVHVINELRSIMVRYIFLLPPGDWDKAPARSVVEPAMTAAFAAIRAMPRGN